MKVLIEFGREKKLNFNGCLPFHAFHIEDEQEWYGRFDPVSARIEAYFQYQLERYFAPVWNESMNIYERSVGETGKKINVERLYTSVNSKVRSVLSNGSLEKFAANHGRAIGFTVRILGSSEASGIFNSFKSFTNSFVVTKLKDDEYEVMKKFFPDGFGLQTIFDLQFEVPSIGAIDSFLQLFKVNYSSIIDLDKLR